MAGRTQVVHTKPKGRYSAITIENRDPRFDYALIRKVDMASGSDMYGWDPIGPDNYNGEMFGNYPGAKTKGSKQMVYLDTIACKRPKETSAWFKQEENERYNRQLQLVQNASKKIQQAFRDIDPRSTVVDRGNSRGPGVTQRVGPTESEELETRTEGT